MADVIISDLPEIVSSTSDDYFIINDGNATTAIISKANLIGSIDSLSNVGFGDGTEDEPSIHFTSDPDVGIYRPGPDTWAVSTLGIQRLVINNSGNVGINQPLPGDWFSGSNNLVIGDPSLGDNGITIVSSTTDVGNISFADGTGVSDSRRGLIRYDHTDDHMRFDVDAAERVRINSDGLIGINETSPDTNIHLNSSTQYGGFLIKNDSEKVVELFGTESDNSNGSLILYENGSKGVELKASGDNIINGKINCGVIQDGGAVRLYEYGHVYIRNDTESAYPIRVYNGAFTDDAVSFEVQTNGNITAAGQLLVDRGFTKVGLGWGSAGVWVGDATSTDQNNAKTRLNSDGSITAAGRVTQGNVSPTTNSNEGGVILYGGSEGGGVRIFRSKSGSSSSGIDLYNNGSQVFSAKTDGSITASGTISVAGGVSSAGNGIQVASDGVVRIRRDIDAEALSIFKNGNSTNERVIVLSTDGNASCNGTVTSSGTFAGVSLQLTGSGTNAPVISTSGTSTITLAPNGTTERIRVDSSGAIGLSGANYGLDGQVLTSQGPGVAPSWTTAATGVPDISELPNIP